MDAFEILKQDHRRVGKLFEQFKESTGRDEKEETIWEIIQELEIHTQLEEELLYPSIRQQVESGDAMADEAEEEHQAAKDLINEIQGMLEEGESYEALVYDLQEAIEHHVNEEENEMFEQARDSSLNAESLGKKLETRRKEILESEKGQKGRAA